MLKNKNITGLISWILIFLALLWLGYIIYNDRQSVINIFSRFTFNNIEWLILSSVFGGISIFVQVFIFKKILHQNTGKKLSLRSLADMYFVGQIVRYLPGRFFGVAYQMNEIKNLISPSIVLKSNIEHMLIALLFNSITASIIILSYKVNTIIFISAVISGFFLFFLYLRFNLIELFLSFAELIFPHKISKYVTGFKSKYQYKYDDIFYITVIYIINWSSYLAAWFCLKNTLPGFEKVNILLICATYTIAIVAGILSMITPGGLGVREYVFVLLTSGEISAPMLAFMSVFLRFWLIFIDLILFIIVKIFLLIFRRL